MTRSARRALVVGNWKMNLTERESVALTDALLPHFEVFGPEIALAPSFPCLRAVAERLSASGVRLAAQDVYERDKGPYTGEVSAITLAEMGARYVIVGHSERRQHFGEDDECVGRKAAAAQRHGMVPIVCVGETKAERAAGETEEVVRRQLRAGLVPVVAAPGGELVVAYEPVWAIGTGEVATPDQVQQVHALLRAELEGRSDREWAEATRILYGGSVTADNAPGLLALDDVDGALVGGASLDAATFLAVARAAC